MSLGPAAGFVAVGHRGAAGHEPENTLRSIRRALELGAAGIEVDVQFVDGELIVFHDKRLERTTNGRGPLARQTFAQIRQLDAGSGERIPTLREVLETVNQRAFVNIELKGPRTAAPVSTLIAEFICHHGWKAEHFLVSSFQRRELRAIIDPAIRIGLLLTRPSRLYHISARHVRAWSVHPAVRYTTRKFVEDAHRRGWKVFPYTANTPTQIAHIKATGADGVFTDYPERVAQSGG
ncbi:MAG TPA: glycerophosphodiester phosphodiesterase family protein [Chthoniobacteraceae bacterium]|nr:glycerophosphodiester phosphodiesterase family protein [Chthoniobacteraceae bacterium]